MKATRKATRTWCLGLIAKQSVSMTVDEVEAQLALSVPALATKFPAEAFCAASLDHVAGIVRLWNEARVSEALTAWTNANQVSTAPALPPEAEAANVGMDAKRWLAMFYRAQNDTAASRALDLIQSYSAEAFGYLLRNDSNAAFIAVAHGWRLPRTIGELQTEWDDAHGIAAFARKYSDPWDGEAISLLRSIVHSYAPQHEHLIPDYTLAERAAAPVRVVLQVPNTIEITEGLFG